MVVRKTHYNLIALVIWNSMCRVAVPFRRSGDKTAVTNGGLQDCKGIKLVQFSDQSVQRDERGVESNATERALTRSFLYRSGVSMGLGFCLSRINGPKICVQNWRMV